MKYLLLALFISNFAFAETSDRDPGVFVGGGFGMGQDLFKLENSSTASKFLNQGWAFAGGITSVWSGRFGGELSAEYGASSGNNTYASETSIETGTLKYYSAKAGLFYGAFTLGAGYRHNDVDVRSVSISPGTYLKTTYSGYTPLAFAAYSLEVKKRFRTTIEGQYVTGSLTGSGAETGTVNFNEAAVSLRFFILFN